MTPRIDTDAIAARIHKFYNDQFAQATSRKDLAVDFSDLAEHMKEDNRDAARRIGQVLALAGLVLVPRGGPQLTEAEEKEMKDLIDENIELLAEGEHDGWVESRLRQGWRVGLCRNMEKRESHLLVPYSRFPEQIDLKRKHEEKAQGRPPTMTLEEEVKKEKDKDRDSVRNYVRIMADTEYRIAREEE